MNWKGIKVFVTGAEGFIGSHLAEALVHAGAEVTAMAQYNSWSSFGWLDNSPQRDKMSLVHGDVRDPDQTIKLLKDQDVVFHLAALMSVPHSTEAPTSYIYTNLLGTQNVLRGLKNASKVIITSTSEVYGTAQSVPITEEHPIVPQSPYAASKVAADALASAYLHSYGCPITILRPFNTYGPRQSERAIIPTIIRQELDSRCNHIKLGSLTPKRDLTYIDDTVGAFLAVGHPDNKITIGETYNAGCGKSVSIGDLADLIVNKPIEHDPDRNRTNEVWRLEADSSKLLQDCGWESYTSLKNGLEGTKRWWKQHLSEIKGEAKYVV